jgi:hypothetical protein
MYASKAVSKAVCLMLGSYPYQHAEFQWQLRIAAAFCSVTCALAASVLFKKRGAATGCQDSDDHNDYNEFYECESLRLVFRRHIECPTSKKY